MIINDSSLADSPEINVEEIRESAVAPTKELETIADYIEAAFDESKIDYTGRREYQNGLIWLIDCPWSHEHTGGKDVREGGSSSAVILWPSGKPQYICKHAHCEQTRQWAIDPTGEMDSLRVWMESVVGRRLSFQDTPEILFGGKPARVVESDDEIDPVASDFQAKLNQLFKMGKSMRQIMVESGFCEMIGKDVDAADQTGSVIGVETKVSVNINLAAKLVDSAVNQISD